MADDAEAKSLDDEQNETEAELFAEFIHDVTIYERKTEAWVNEGKKIIQRYKNEKIRMTDGYDESRMVYNILWSNVQTLKPAVYSRMPKVACDRRWKDSSKFAAFCSLVAERAVQYSFDIENNRFCQGMEYAVDDWLLPGRGVLWERYEPAFQSDDDDLERVADERAVTDYIYWQDFGHSEARTWEEVNAVWKKIYLTKAELQKYFGKAKAKEVPLDDDRKTITDEDEEKVSKRATVYERWDKKRKKAYWFCKGAKDTILKFVDDPLGLIGFFPCPQPLFATLTSDSLIPVADYTLYQTLADDLDFIVRRKAALTDCLRLIGGYDAACGGDLARMKEMPDGVPVPIKGWTQYAEKGGLKGITDWFPIEPVANVIAQLTEEEKSLTQKIYEVMGISDIMRGVTNPYETKSAQEIKAQVGVQRNSKRQAAAQRFVADIAKIKADIIFGHFDPEIVKFMIGFDSLAPEQQAMFPQAFQVLKDDKQRTYTITIETDSIIAADEQADRDSANEYITAVGNLLQQAFNAVQLDPSLKPVMLQLILFGARRYRTGRPIESQLEKIFEEMLAADQAAAENPPEEPPDPEMIKVEQEGQIAQMRLEMEMQLGQAKAEIERMKATMDAELKQFKAQNDAMLKQQKIEGTLALSAQKAQAEMAIQAQSAQTQDWAAMQTAMQPVMPEPPKPAPVTINIDAS